MAAVFSNINGNIWEYSIHVAIDRVIDLSTVVGNTAAGAAELSFSIK